MTRKHYCEKDSEEGCLTCSFYETRKENVSKGIIQPFYVLSVGVSRHFGGREEGGWWYDWTSINEVRKAYTLKAALKHARELREEYPQPRFDRYSCANRGETDNYIAVCYGETDPRWPEESKERPRYE